MYLSVQKLHPSAKLPLRATKDSAGCDLYACLDKPLTIAPGEIAKIPTGLAIAPSRKDIAICIFPRSGLSTKHGIPLANSVGQRLSWRAYDSPDQSRHRSFYCRIRDACGTACSSADSDSPAAGGHCTG